MIYHMQVRYYFTPTLVRSLVGIFGISVVAMAGFSLVAETADRAIPFLIVAGSLIALLWFGLTQGSYIQVNGRVVYGVVCFFRGRVTPLEEIIAVHTRPTFGGYIAEIYMEVRGKDGKVRDRGLVGHGALAAGDFRALLEAMRRVNPEIRIDDDVLSL
jgi:hypothetical protein